MGVTDERLAVVAFSNPYTRATNGFLTTATNALKDLPDSGVSFSLADDTAAAEAEMALLKENLARQVIGVQTGSTAASFASAYFVGP